MELVEWRCVFAPKINNEKICLYFHPNHLGLVLVLVLVFFGEKGKRG